MSKPFDPEDFPYTLFHDDLAPIIARLRGSSVKLLYYIMLKSRVDFTHFRPVPIRYREMLKESGIKSSRTLSMALQQLIEARIVTRQQTGHITGAQGGIPLYDYSINLDYETSMESLSALQSKVAALESKAGVALQSKVTALESKAGVALQSKVTALEGKAGGTALSAVDVRDVSTGRGAPLDHDHEEDLSLEEDLLRSDPEQILMARLQALGQSRAQAHQLIEKQGVQNAWQWYAYVVDPENKVDSPIGYLYTAAIANASPPPLTYQVWEISQVETAYHDRQAVRAADLETARFPAAARSPDPVSPNALLWRRALDDLRMQVPSAAFGRWLAGSELVAIDDDVAMVQVGDGYAVEWLSTRWKAMILRTLSAIAGVQSPPVTISDVKFEERKDHE